MEIFYYARNRARLYTHLLAVFGKKNPYVMPQTGPFDATILIYHIREEKIPW